MDTTLFQNILFTALSVFLVFLTVGFVVVIVFVVMFLKSLHELVKKIKKEGEIIFADIDHIRQKVKNSGATATSFMMQGLSWFKKRANKKSKKEDIN